MIDEHEVIISVENIPHSTTVKPEPVDENGSVYGW